jgi:sporulation protein YlmC with PRC-barrel domain
MSSTSMGGSGMSDRSGDVARNETSSLISSDKVEGTSVYDTAGNSLGSIHSVMIGKTDGKVSYAVLSFGGFLGIGSDYYPIPWAQLRYDTSMDGYVINITKEQLEGAPRYSSGDDWQTANRSWTGDVDRYYTGPAFPAV